MRTRGFCRQHAADSQRCCHDRHSRLHVMQISLHYSREGMFHRKHFITQIWLKKKQYSWNHLNPGGLQQIKQSQGHVEEKQAVTLISTCSFLYFLLLWWLKKVDFWIYWAENRIYIPSWLCETTAQKQALPPSAAQREFVEFLSLFIVNQSFLTNADIKVEVAANSQCYIPHNHMLLVFR